MDRKRTARSAEPDGTDGCVRCGLQGRALDGQLCAVSPELVSLIMENSHGEGHTSSSSELEHLFHEGLILMLTLAFSQTFREFWRGPVFLHRS